MEIYKILSSNPNVINILNQNINNKDKNNWRNVSS